MRWRDVDLDAGLVDDSWNGHEERRTAPRATRRGRNRDHQGAGEETTSAKEFVFVGFGASVLDRAKKAPAAIARVLDVDFRGHDLRRTAATRMAAAGVPRDHIARVLNHVEGGARATRVYDRHSYDREKRTRARGLGALADTTSSRTSRVPAPTSCRSANPRDCFIPGRRRSRRTERRWEVHRGACTSSGRPGRDRVRQRRRDCRRYVGVQR